MNSDFDNSSKTLSGLIRHETDLGIISEKHLTWLCMFVQSAYNAPNSRAVVYFEKNKKYVYVQPLDADKKPIKKGDLQMSDALKDKNMNHMQKGLSSYLKLNGYMIRIVRDLPSAVKRARNVTELA